MKIYLDNLDNYLLQEDGLTDEEVSKYMEIDKKLSYDILVIPQDEDVKDVVLKIRNLEEDNSIIGYIAIRLVPYDRYEPFTSVVMADDCDGQFYEEINFLVKQKELKNFWKEESYYSALEVRVKELKYYIGHVYQFDLEKKYKNIGIEKRFLNDLPWFLNNGCFNTDGYDCYMIANTIYLTNPVDDAGDISPVIWNRKRKFSSPIDPEIIKNCGKYKTRKYNGADYTYAVWHPCIHRLQGPVRSKVIKYELYSDIDDE